MNGYELSRAWFDFSFENPEKISPNHGAIYFFAIEHNNRLGWRNKFGFPSQMTMDAIGIKKHSTYIRYFNDLVDWDFFKLIQKSQNQYSSNIISLTSAMPKKGEALDKAIMNHRDKHGANQSETIGITKRSIDKPLNNLTTKPIKQHNKEKVYSKEVHNSFINCSLNFPEHLMPNNENKKNQWLDTLDKLERIDKIPFDIIENVVMKTRRDPFWSKNFLSLTKLRKKNKDDIMYIVVFNEQIKNIDPCDNNEMTEKEFNDSFN